MGSYTKTHPKRESEEMNDYNVQFDRLVRKWMSKGYQKQDAEDIAQDAIIKALEASDEEKARSYLDRAAEHVVIDRWRKSKGMTEVELEEHMEPESEEMEESAEHKEEVREMYRRINTRLTPENAAIMMAIAQGDTAEEIGWNMKMPVGTVRKRVYDGKEKLR